MIFPRSSRRTLPSIIVLLLVAALGILMMSLWGGPFRSNPAETAQLEATAKSTTDLIQTQVEVYAQTLYGARAFLAASDNVTRADWQAYYQTVGVGRRLESMSGFAFIRRVSAEEKSQFLNEMQRDSTLQTLGYEEISLTPDTFKSEYYFVTLLEPSTTERIRGTLGFDISSEPVRRAALEQARDTDQAVLTGPIISPTQNVPSFAMYVPVYEISKSHQTPDERREAIQGAVSMGFEVERLFTQAFGDLAAQDIRVQVYDGPEVRDNGLIFDSMPSGVGTPDVSTVLRTLDVAGQTWTFAFQAPNAQSKLAIPHRWSRLTFVVLTNAATALTVWYWAHSRRGHRSV